MLPVCAMAATANKATLTTDLSIYMMLLKRVKKIAQW